MSLWKKSQHHHGRRSPAHWMLCLLMAVVLLVGELPGFRVAAADDGTLENTYALVITNGSNTAAGNLAEEIQYFKIVYEGTDGYLHNHRIFPGEGDLQESLQMAEDVGKGKRKGSSDDNYDWEQMVEFLQNQELWDWTNLRQLRTSLEKYYPEDYAWIQQNAASNPNTTAQVRQWFQYAVERVLPKVQEEEAKYEAAYEELKANSPQPLNDTRRGYAKQLGYPVKDIDQQKAFEAYGTDTYFFQPLKDLKSIKRVEILTRDDGTWNCQSMRLYKVDRLYGLGMSGYISNQQYASFEGTLLMKMDDQVSSGGASFSWPVDRMQRVSLNGDKSVTADGKVQYTPDATLSEVNEPYKTSTTDYVFRLDIADVYGAGIEALGNKTGAGIVDSKFVEEAALELKYRDTAGVLQYVRVPLITSVLGYAMEKGVNMAEKLSGIAQQGDTLALTVSLPDFAEFDGSDAVRLLYGTALAESMTGISYAGTSSNHTARAVSASKDSGTADTLTLIGFSMYDPTVTDIDIKVEGTMLRPVFRGEPLRYYRAQSIQGYTISPVSTYKESWVVTMTDYASGNPLLPKDQEERYLIVLKTDDQELAATTGNLEMTLQYTDLSGKKQKSDTLKVSDCVNAYTGYWPGVSSDFAYRVGINAGQELNCIVTLKDVDRFTGVTFRIAGSNDDWQLKGIQIMRLEDLGVRSAEWKTVTNGKETSDREYSRDCKTSGTVILDLNRQVLIGTGDDQNLEFKSESTVEVSESKDWSEYRYSMSYEQTQKLGSFTKARYNYTVAVQVANDVATSYQDGDCGSKNQFYFLLVFQNGSSGYVLANQQLSADGFRTGYNETFTVSTNRDMGELTAVRILPEDISDKSDVFDKLKIDEIRVSKQDSGPSCKQWVIGNVGWIDIDYRDDAEGTSMTGRNGRSEEELSKAYRVDYSTSVINFQFAITTADYVTNGSKTDDQLEGQVTGELYYYDTKGQTQRMTFDAVRAMYDYSNKQAKIATADTNYQTEGNAMSDKTTMFRANHTDRFTLSVNDVSQLLSLTLKVKPSVVTQWNIKEVSVSLTGTDGQLLINGNNEYELVSSTTEQQALCTRANTETHPILNVWLPRGQENEAKIEFTENKIEATEENVVSAVSRLPQSTNDTMNIYVYMDEDSPAMSEYTMDAAVQYSKVFEGTYQSSVTLTQSRGDDGNVWFADGLSASGMNTLSSLWLRATPKNGRSVELIKVDHAIVQQVRSDVVIDTYYLDFSGRDASLLSISASPSQQKTGATSKQVVTLSFGDGTDSTWLIAEDHDVAVAMQYTTTAGYAGNDPVYASPYVYLTDQNWKELHSGKTVTIEFEQSDVKEIKGINLVGTGNMTAVVDRATVALYDVNETAKTETCTGWFSFRQGMTIGAAAKTMACTSMETSGLDAIRQITLGFTTPEVSGNAVRSISGEVELMLSYIDDYDARRTMVIPDIRQYVVDGNGDFAAGTTTTARLLLPGCKELRWIQLNPRDENGNPVDLKLNSLSVKMQAGSEETSYMRDLKDWTSDQPIDLYSTTVTVTARTHSDIAGTTTEKTAENGNIQLLVESDQTVDISVEVDGSDAGYRYKAEEVSAESSDYTKDADSFLTLNEDEDGLVFKPPVHYGTSEVYYRITIYSEEVPMVRCVVELAVQPGEKPEPVVEEPSAGGGGGDGEESADASAEGGEASSEGGGGESSDAG